jgi:hypothetical protein
VSEAIPLRDYPAVRQDPILAALFEDLRLHLRPHDQPLVTDIPEDPATRYRVWVRSGDGGRTFGAHRPTLAQAIDSLIAKLR